MNWDLFEVKDNHSFIRYKKLIDLSINGKFDDYDLFEKHHIFPLALFPNQTEIVKVPLKLHFILHYLLFKFTKTKEMTFAFNQMRRISPNSRLYKKNRIFISQVISECNKGRPCSDERKRQISECMKGTYNYKSPDNVIQRFKIGEQPEDWVSFKLGQLNSQAQKDKLSSMMKDRKWYYSIFGDVCFSHKNLEDDFWIQGMSEKFKKQVSQRMKGLKFFYNEKTKEQVRSYESPGDDWIQKRIYKGNFKGFQNINSEKRYLNLKTKQIEISAEKQHWHINHPGHKIESIIFIIKDKRVYCNSKSLDFPFKGCYNITNLLSFVIPKPHHNMTEQNKHFCLEHQGKTFKDIGFDFVLFNDFQYDSSFTFIEE